MKKTAVFSAAALAGGIAAFALRLAQNRTGFEPETGLPVPGNTAGMVLIILLAVMAAGLLLLSRLLPEEAPEFPFPAQKRELLVLPVLGSFLMALSGAANVLEGLGSGNLLLRLQAQADPYSSYVEPLGPVSGDRVHLVLGVLTIVFAACLFLAVLACGRNGRTVGSFDAGTGLLTVPVVLVVQLILTYRKVSVNPSLEAYYVELLALMFLILGFYRLASLVFGAGGFRRFAWCVGMAVVLGLAALPDSLASLPSLLLYAGGFLTLLGCLLQTAFVSEQT